MFISSSCRPRSFATAIRSTTLDRGAFKVLDEGKPVKIAKFEHVKNLPLSLGLAIDTSGSMQPRMAEAQKAASHSSRT